MCTRCFELRSQGHLEPRQIETVALAVTAHKKAGVTIAKKPSKYHFLFSDSIRDIEHTLAKNERPLQLVFRDISCPPTLMRLFLKYPHGVKSVTVEPSGALAISKLPDHSTKGLIAYSVRGKVWGHSRLTITYDSLTQTIQYFVTKLEKEVVADMGRFLTTKDWFTDP